MTKIESETKKLRFRGAVRQLMIIDSCRELIIEQGFSELSLRKVARKAGIGLSSLQYHFRTKEELIQGVVLNTRDIYIQQRLEIKDKNKGDPLSQFTSITLWLVNDLKQKKTAHLFTQLWAQSMIDKFTAEIVEQIYKEYCETYAEMINRLQPKLNYEESMIRSVKIVSLIEGLMLFLGAERCKLLENVKNIENSTVDTAIQIAMS